MTRKDVLTDDNRNETQDHFSTYSGQHFRPRSTPKYRPKYPPTYWTPPRTRKAIIPYENAPPSAHLNAPRDANRKPKTDHMQQSDISALKNLILNIAPERGKHSAKRGFLVRQTGCSSAPNGVKHATNPGVYALCNFPALDQKKGWPPIRHVEEEGGD